MRERLIRYCGIILLAVTIAGGAQAQDASRIYIEPTGWSLGVNFGMADMWGDVGTKSIADHYLNSKYFDKPTFLGGMFGRYTIHPGLAVRFGLNFGTIFATDEWNYDKAIIAKTQGEDPYQRYARSQRTKSNVVELMTVMEFTPFRLNPEKRIANRRGQVYLTGGIGIFHFTPYGTPALSNKYVELYDLHIEGDGFGNDSFPKAYSLFQPLVSGGIGYRWDVGKHLNFGVEYNYRYTFTDYLDGVSGKYINPTEYTRHLTPEQVIQAIEIQDKASIRHLSMPNKAGNPRGNPADNDSYSTISIHFYYKVFTRTKQWWKL